MFSKASQIHESVLNDHDAIVVAANIFLETLAKHAQDEIKLAERSTNISLEHYIENILKLVLLRNT
jgi:hypothetical protein